MKKLVALAGAVLALSASALSGAATTKGTTWEAHLTAAQEVPKQAVKMAAAHGEFKASLTGRKLKWKLTFAHLTGPAVAAHIYLGAAGKTGDDPVISICPPCKNGLSGTSTLTPAVIADFAKPMYVNLYTARNPYGEIRGQLVKG